jgi:hypothetical protein
LEGAFLQPLDGGESLVKTRVRAIFSGAARVRRQTQYIEAEAVCQSALQSNEL